MQILTQETFSHLWVGGSHPKQSPSGAGHLSKYADCLLPVISHIGDL